MKGSQDMDVDGRDPGAWILDQRMSGQTQEDIADLLNGAWREKVRDLEQWLTGRTHQKEVRATSGKKTKIRQYTLSRNEPRARANQPLTPIVENAVLAFFACEDEADRLIDEWQTFFLASMDALLEWKVLNDFDEEQARLKIRREAAARLDFEKRQEEARAAGKAVNDVLRTEGFMAPDNTVIFGDGIEFFNEANSAFRYATKGAMIVGFGEPDARCPCGLTFEEHRELVPKELRMRNSAVKAGEPRPAMIGVRDALRIPAAECIDAQWFFEDHYPDIARWYELRGQAPEWWKERTLPRETDSLDIAWYREVLELETKLMGGPNPFTFEESILRWGADWRSEVEQKRKMFQSLKWRLACRESGLAMLRTAGWTLGAIAAVVAAWKFVVPFLATMGKGIRHGVDVALGHSVASYQNAFLDYEKVGEWMGGAFVLVITSPIALVGFSVVMLMLLIVTTAVAFDRERSKDYYWLLAALIVFIVLTVVTGVGTATTLISVA